MANDNLKYTEEELVDFGWTQIENQLPRKRKRRAIWLWLPAAAIVLGVLSIYYFGSHDQNNAKQVTEIKSDSENSKELPTDSFAIEQMPSTVIGELENQIRIEESITDKNSSMPRSDNLGNSIDRPKQNRQTNPHNPLRVDVMIAEFSQSEIIIDEDLTNQDRIEQNTKSFIVSNEENQAPKSENNKEVTNASPDETLIKPLIEEKETQVAQQTKQQVSDAAATKNVEAERRVVLKKKKPKKRVESFANLKASTNKFDNLGPSFGAGAILELNKNQEIGVGLHTTYMQEDLSSFTTLTPIGQAVSQADDTFLTVNYDALLVEFPVTFRQRISERIMLEGGVVAQYANFVDYLSENPADNQEFLVQVSNRPTDNLTVTGQFQSYRINSDFVEQFDQLAVGFQAGGAAKLSNRLEVITSASFAYQSFTDTPFLDYNPSLIQIGANYFLSNKKN